MTQNGGIPDPDAQRDLGPVAGPPGFLHRMSIPLLVRILSHALVWLFLLIPAAIEMARGWRPQGDNATIALQSFRALSLHPPLLGQQATVEAGAHYVLSSPGPLQYYLLAIPTHLDSHQGPLWGAAIVSALVLSVAIEALWRAGLWLGCGAVAFCLVDLAWLANGVVTNIIWNPNMGLPFVMATMALAWVVSVGRLGWWPVLVATGSMAPQIEVFYAPLTISVGVVQPNSWRSLFPAQDPTPLARSRIGVSLLCWLPAIIQEFTGRTGNLTAYLHANGTQKSLGFGFGLRTVAFTVWPQPIWIRHAGYLALLRGIAHSPKVLGALIPIAMAAIAFVAWRRKEPNLSALAAVGAVFLP